MAARESFDRAFEVVLGHEGRYANNPNDPGGETKYGISKRSHSKLDIAALTLEDAKEIYRKEYWNAVSGDILPDKIAFQVFDAAVNHGSKAGIKMMQSALEVESDGIIGAQTLKAAWACDVTKFGVLFNAARLDFYTTLTTWPNFGRGWVHRITKNLRELF